MMGQDFDARRADHAARWGAESGAALAPAPAPAHNRVSLSPGPGLPAAVPSLELRNRGEFEPYPCHQLDADTLHSSSWHCHCNPEVVNVRVLLFTLIFIYRNKFNVVGLGISMHKTK